jgi:hypothetical protein
MEWTSTSEIGTAILFNGSNAYVNIPHNDSMNLSAFSIALWIRTHDVGQQHVIFSKGQDGADNYRLIQNKKEITLAWQDAGGTKKTVGTSNIQTCQTTQVHIASQATASA